MITASTIIGMGNPLPLMLFSRTYVLTYYCKLGHQLEGNRQARCNADGTWSSEPVTCTILKCNDPEVEIENSQSVGVCNVTYGLSCSLNCSSGFSVSANLVVMVNMCVMMRDFSKVEKCRRSFQLHCCWYVTIVTSFK